jgi:hypothetical protein
VGAYVVAKDALNTIALNPQCRQIGSRDEWKGVAGAFYGAGLRDAEELLRLGLGRAGELGRPIDPSPGGLFGDDWPGGRPPLLAEVESGGA